MGNDAVFLNAVDKVNMSTTGNGVDYADLNYNGSQNGAFGSRTHSIFLVDTNRDLASNSGDCITTASGGTATAGGALTQDRRGMGRTLDCQIQLVVWQWVVLRQHRQPMLVM